MGKRTKKKDHSKNSNSPVYESSLKSKLDSCVRKLSELTSKNFLLEKNVLEIYKNVYEKICHVVELEKEIGKCW